MPENWSLEFPTRLDTIRSAKSQKKATRGLKYFRFRKKRDCTIHGAKTLGLISCAVTSQLISAFVSAYAKFLLPHDMAHIMIKQRPDQAHRKYLVSVSWSRQFS